MATTTYWQTHSCYYKDITPVVKCENCPSKIGCNEYLWRLEEV